MSFAKEQFELWEQEQDKNDASELPRGWLDLSAEETDLPGDDKIKTLSQLGKMYQTSEKIIADLEEQLTRVKETFRTLREDLIPEKMLEYGVKKIILTDGSELSYKPFYDGRLVDPYNEAGFIWLEEQGYADAVKQEFKASTSRIDKASLEKIKKFVRDSNFDNLSIEEKVSIHHMKLGAIVRELNTQGKDLPDDLFKTWIGNRATLKAPGKGNLDG